MQEELHDFINMKVVVNVRLAGKVLVDVRMLERMKIKGSEEIEMLEEVTKQIEGHTICIW